MMGMAEVVPIERPEQLTDLVLTRLRQDIVEGVFELGGRLSEQQLSTRYRVTKAPIRSACIRLQGEGLLRIVAQRGIYVFDPTAAEVRALCELRAALELEAAALALSRNRQRLADDLDLVLARMRPFAGDPATVAELGYQRLDSEFHLTILAAAGSPMLLEAYRTTVDRRFSALRTRLSRQRAHAENSFREHLEIQAAVVEGDLPGLQALLRRHIDNTDRYFARLLDERAETAIP